MIWKPPPSHLQIGIEQSQRTGNPLIQSDGYRTLAVLLQAGGDPGAALATLEKMDQLADSHEVTPLTRLRNAACHVQIALAQDDFAAASRWAEQVTDAADASLFYPRLGLTPARLLLAQGKKIEAARELEGLYETARLAGWDSGMVEVRALQAMAADTPDDALHFLEDALRRRNQKALSALLWIKASR